MRAPTSLSDLLKSSVYYSIFNQGNNESDVKKNLRPAYGKYSGASGQNIDYSDPRVIAAYAQSIEMDSAGGIVYYAGKPDGSYEASALGQFVKVNRGTPNEHYVHYSRIFQPTEEARKNIDTLSLVMGLTYEVAAQQIAFLNDCIAESEKFNDRVSQIIGAYTEFTIAQTNIDTAKTNGSIYLSYAELKKYLDLELAPSQTQFIVGVQPRPMIISVDLVAAAAQGCATATKLLYPYKENGEIKWGVHQFLKQRAPRYGKPIAKSTVDDTTDYFIKKFAGREGTKEPVTEAERVAFAQAYVDRFGDQNFSVRLKVETTGAWCIQYDEPVELFDTALNGSNYSASDKTYMGSGDPQGFWAGDFYKATRDYIIDPAIYAVKDSIENVMQGEKGVFISRHGLQNFSEFLRTTSDNITNRLNAIGTIISSENYALQQNYSIGTNTVEALGEQKQKVLNNLR